MDYWDPAMGTLALGIMRRGKHFHWLRSETKLASPLLDASFD